MHIQWKKIFSVFYKDRSSQNQISKTHNIITSIKINVCVLHEEEIVNCNLAG